MMKLPDHENLHGCVKVILGDILECSLIDALVLPLGSRIHARWDTIICGERRTIRETFSDDPEQGRAQTQLENYRPIVQFCFESEERARAKYGEKLPMPKVDREKPVDRQTLLQTTLNAARDFAQAVADGSMSRNNAEALATELRDDIDRSIAVLDNAPYQERLAKLEAENRELGEFVVAVGGFWGKSRSTLVGELSLAESINRCHKLVWAAEPLLEEIAKHAPTGIAAPTALQGFAMRAKAIIRESRPAVTAANKDVAPPPRNIRTPMPYIASGDSDGGECD